MLIRIITWIIVFVVVYRILNKYILPVVRISSAANDHMRQMQQQMSDMQRRMKENEQQQAQQAPRQVKKDGDYIDYEEVK